ncbi:MULTISPECIES: helix-turn-helix domain-containing protein [Oscillospiraceae]|uniref:Helix-turn-helix transcriptional regulator n=1 Tax=Lawsonibacter faecis TaxID=2763052 RepID=A0A8J6M803_9FIRM|nr:MULTISPECIES: helix-turn-helix transcriptional regulator [Oscillospiraceae]MTQ95355.1 helix-turn-helix domain-containing protein [Pseudoflavonifractor sp. BIOML-A16]MTR07070.1 helix-turn-helix domain-containing protein [Pseudoflavonifractor sp. BIOML-A15]MTR32367.1 helix-turn-helix domain-containing protein [Pseudoflavonifractor sp. BIOML-A14]MTR72719.1 helix-turn-helix domain-containing protein [Pseudoflavonifractor sp. BIOML-A18]MTS64383.1 helix-turn-helix domain-containing protein [Pseud
MHFQRIEDLRIDHDKSQIEIAAYLNLNRNVYWRYEKGIREIPAWAVIKLAELYETSTDYILGCTDDPAPPHA